MQWTVKKNQTSSDSGSHVSREKLFKQLRRRYNFTDDMWHRVEEVTLPHSRSRVKIVWNDAKHVIQSLLTDPRITDDDCLFHDDNPFAPPPKNLSTVKDLNTGEAHRDTCILH